MHLIPRCSHGPFCTGGPMHIPLAPANAFERWLIGVFPPLTREESNRQWLERLRQEHAQFWGEEP